MRARPAVLLCLCAWGAAAQAGQPFALESRGGPGVWSGAEAWRVQYLGDNDSVGMLVDPETGHGFDRWYTTGTQLLVRRAVDPSGFAWLPERSRLLVSAGLSQNIYTPRNARLTSVAQLQGDRPYAGTLLGTLGAEAVVPFAPLAFTRGGTPVSHLGLDVSLGTTGPWSLAGPVQHASHEGWRALAGQPVPPIVGWGEAETRGGLAAEVAAFGETSLAAWSVDAPTWMQWSGAQPSLHWVAGTRLTAGTVRLDAAASTTVAFGWMGDPLATQPTAFPLCAWLYLRGELRGVLGNSTIDGRLLDGSVSARAAPLVADVSLGAVLRLYGLEVSWVHAYRTNEVATLAPPLNRGQWLWHWSLAWVW